MHSDKTVVTLEQLAAGNKALSVVDKKMLAALTPSAERRLCVDLTACAAVLGDPAGEADPG